MNEFKILIYFGDNNIQQKLNKIVHYYNGTGYWKNETFELKCISIGDKHGILHINPCIQIYRKKDGNRP